MFRSRPFSRPALTDLLDLITRNAAARGPGLTYLMNSDVAWQLPGSAPKDNIRLWYDDQGPAGYAWFQPPGGMLFDVRHDLPGQDELQLEMLEWASTRRALFGPDYPFYLDLQSMAEWADVLRHRPTHPLSGNRYLVVSALESDVGRTELLKRQGFEATQHFAPHMARSLRTIPDPEPPAGMRLHPVEPADFERRVALHVAAWAPGSSFTQERYQAVRAVDGVFDPELDIVAESGDGDFAAYTIAWHDAISGIGSFEPVGAHPDFRGTGAIQAVMFEALRRLAARGMHSAKVSTAGFNHQAVRLYRSCGFEVVDVNRTFIRPR